MKAVIQQIEKQLLSFETEVSILILYKEIETTAEVKYSRFQGEVQIYSVEIEGADFLTYLEDDVVWGLEEKALIDCGIKNKPTCLLDRGHYIK